MGEMKEILTGILSSMEEASFRLRSALLNDWVKEILLALLQIPSNVNKSLLLNGQNSAYLAVCYMT